MLYVSTVPYEARHVLYSLLGTRMPRQGGYAVDASDSGFEGRVVLITGAATGIGRAAALAFAQRGAHVAVLDINEDAGSLTAQKIQQAGGKAEFFKCDVSRSEDVQKSIREVVRRFGRLDIAFNNAGIEGATSATAERIESEWDKVLNTNLKGVWLCMKYELEQMLKGGGGVIVNNSSIAGLVGFEQASAYVASKHGIIGLTKTAALEYAKFNIRVNAVCPGVIHTPMVDRFTQGSETAIKQLEAGTPIGRLGQPEEIAAAALWLSSPQASFVTGHALVADGGWIAH